MSSNLARSFVALNRGHHDTETSAIVATARQSRLTPAVLMRFLYPSRRPKSVGLDIWQRLRLGYPSLLRRQLAALETEIVRIEVLDDPDHSLCRLLDDAETLADRIRSIIEA